MFSNAAKDTPSVGLKYTHLTKRRFKIVAEYLTYDPMLGRLTQQLIQASCYHPPAKQTLQIALNMLKILAEHRWEETQSRQHRIPLRHANQAPKRKRMYAWYMLNRVLAQALCTLQTCPPVIESEVCRAIVTELRATLHRSA